MEPDAKNVAPTAQTADGGNLSGSDDASWLKRAQAAFRSSTTYMDNNLRKGWDDSIRMFNNQHPSDSKYNSPAYDKRSKLFRPKIRSVIRKNEAAAAAAFFSNMEVVDVTAVNPSIKEQQISAEVMKPLLEYRLNKSIPWFQIVLGGLQDAQSVGTVCAHISWIYKAKPGQPDTLPPQATVEKTQVEENEYPEQKNIPEGDEAIKGGEATAPVPMSAAPTNLPGAGIPQSTNSAMPPTMGQVPPGPPAQVFPGMPIPPQAPGQPPQPGPRPPAKMVAGREAIEDRPDVDLIPVENLRIDPSAKWYDPVNTSPYIIHMIPMYVMDIRERMKKDWKPFSDSVILSAGDGKLDSTRSARQSNKTDQYSTDNQEVNDYKIAWVQRHIHRRDDIDWEFYTLGDQQMLTTPRPLKEVVFHGKRPYVMGTCILETHKTYTSSIGQLGKGLQDEANEVANQRIDNVKFVLNKKWFIKRGKDVDVGGLVRNVPGGVVSMDDPEKDVREVTWQDVTSSAYEEQRGLDNDMNELLGNFSPAQVMADHGIQGPARNMQMLNQSAGTLVEYLLLTYTMTFLEPVLRQIVLLEQHYETDQAIIDIATSNSKLFQKFGIDKITDQLLEQELTLKVNVGMGATDPGMKLQRFTAGVTNYANLTKMAPPGLNLDEVGKEMFGHMGYADGKRFFTNEDPMVVHLQQQLQQMQMLIQQLEAKVRDKMMGHQVKAAVAEDTNQTKLKIAKIHEDNDNLRASVIHMRAIVEANKNRDAELVKLGLQHNHELNRPKTMGEAQ